MRIVDRRRHEFRCLVASIAEHDALIAGALVLVSAGVDALGNVGRLGVQQYFDLRPFPMEARLLVADGANRLASGVDEGIFGEGGAADFPGDDHPIGGRQGLAGHPNLIGVDACLGPSRKKRSTISSEMRSQTLSGCPSETDSLVKR